MLESMCALRIGEWMIDALIIRKRREFVQISQSGFQGLQGFGDLRVGIICMQMMQGQKNEVGLVRMGTRLQLRRWHHDGGDVRRTTLSGLGTEAQELVLMVGEVWGKIEENTQKDKRN